MRAIHSLAAPPGPPPARPPPRRGTTAASASPLRESSPPQPQPPPPAPPSLASRRAALLALAMVAAPARPFAAAAFSLGIPGPKELLREQKKKSASFLLAPIAASRDTLLKAQALLASPNASAEDAEEVRGRIGAAGRDCVPRQRNSIVAFQSKTGVEVCTFSLILKNAASLLTKKDPLKVEADTRLGELIQSFSDLGTIVENSNFELTGDREKMKDGVLSSISALDKFEQSVKDCLGV
ncbi:hypothetical protein SEVIR_9G071600v4 [Setaria viridis]|uniref:Uncharacterized protein n=1 Tax=Setaria viridis TaxID=4556 RepID=A0A4V6D0J1_SETVI|nr:WW domain-binding protein 11 [Setaria viridis]TKV91075.1 hypothetical protein SEVIR_9G071600v2 [Setaria viridis]